MLTICVREGRIAAIAGATLSLLGGGALAQSPPGVWLNKTPMPEVHTEPGATTLDGKLYVIGGSTKDVDDLPTGLVYDPATDAWRSIAPMPRGLNHDSTVTLGGKIYVVGGFSGRGPGAPGARRVHQGAEPFVFAFDPAANAWATLAPLSAPRGSVGAAVVDGKLHAIGGRGLDVKTVATHEVYDPATNVWSPRAAMPNKRDHAFVVAARGLIHVIGGRTDDRDDNVGDHDIYDPGLDAWSKGPPLPTPRSGGQAALLGDFIVTYGGESSKKTFDNVEVFDLVRNTWIAFAPAPKGLHASAGATIGDTVYFAGGSIGPGGDAITNALVGWRMR